MTASRDFLRSPEAGLYWQATAWLLPSAHRLVAQTWWGVLPESMAREHFDIEVRCTLARADWPKTFQWQPLAAAIFSEVMEEHCDAHSASFTEMRRAALEAMRAGQNRSQAAQSVAAIAKSRPVPPPPFLVLDAVDSADKEMFFAARRAGVQPTTKIRRRRARSR